MCPMISEHLTGAPAPSPAARDAAIGNALAAFDEKFSARSQGRDPDTRLMRQTASPSRRSSTMPRTRYLIAASLVAIVAGSATWIQIQEHYAPALQVQHA